MKPMLDISSPVAQRLASNALFERIQKAFNLYPSKMLVHLKERARKEERSAQELLAEILETITKRVLPETLDALARQVQGEWLAAIIKHSDRTKEFSGYFNLPSDTEDLMNMADRLTETARREGFDAGAAAEELKKDAPIVFDWAFAEVLRILVREGRS